MKYPPSFCFRSGQKREMLHHASSIRFPIPAVHQGPFVVGQCLLLTQLFYSVLLPNTIELFDYLPIIKIEIDIVMDTCSYRLQSTLNPFILPD